MYPRKTVSDDNYLERVPSDSEVAKSLQRKIENSFERPDISLRQWKCSEYWKIRNPVRQISYEKIRLEMKQNDRFFKESIGFLYVDSEIKLKSLAMQGGVKIGNLSESKFGLASKGVSLCTCADIYHDGENGNDCDNGILVLLKYVHCNTQFVSCFRRNTVVPMRLFGCHGLQSTPNTQNIVDMRKVFYRNQVLLYEYTENDEAIEYPSQILPIGAVRFCINTKNNNSLDLCCSQLTSSKQMPQYKDIDVIRKMRKCSTLKQKLLADYELKVGLDSSSSSSVITFHVSLNSKLTVPFMYYNMKRKNLPLSKLIRGEDFCKYFINSTDGQYMKISKTTINILHSFPSFRKISRTFRAKYLIYLTLSLMSSSELKSFRYFLHKLSLYNMVGQINCLFHPDLLFFVFANGEVSDKLGLTSGNDQTELHAVLIFHYHPDFQLSRYRGIRHHIEEGIFLSCRTKYDTSRNSGSKSPILSLMSLKQSCIDQMKSQDDFNHTLEEVQYSSNHLNSELDRNVNESNSPENKSQTTMISATKSVDIDDSNFEINLRSGGITKSDIGDFIKRQSLIAEIKRNVYGSANETPTRKRTLTHSHSPDHHRKKRKMSRKSSSPNYRNRSYEIKKKKKRKNRKTVRRKSLSSCGKSSSHYSKHRSQRKVLSRSISSSRKRKASKAKKSRHKSRKRSRSCSRLSDHYASKSKHRSTEISSKSKHYQRHYSSNSHRNHSRLRSLSNDCNDEEKSREHMKPLRTKKYSTSSSNKAETNKIPENYANLTKSSTDCLQYERTQIRSVVVVKDKSLPNGCNNCTSKNDYEVIVIEDEENEEREGVDDAMIRSDLSRLESLKAMILTQIENSNNSTPKSQSSSTLDDNPNVVSLISPINVRQQRLKYGERSLIIKTNDKQKELENISISDIPLPVIGKGRRKITANQSITLKSNFKSIVAIRAQISEQNLSDLSNKTIKNTLEVTDDVNIQISSVNSNKNNIPNNPSLDFSPSVDKYPSSTVTECPQTATESPPTSLDGLVIDNNDGSNPQPLNDHLQSSPNGAFSVFYDSSPYRLFTSSRVLNSPSFHFVAGSYASTYYGP